jgi:hypothetical protein
MNVIRSFFMLFALFSCLLGITTYSYSKTQDVSSADMQRSEARNEYAGSKLLNIPLVWKPTETISSLAAIDLTIFKNASLTIKPFNDMRKNPSEIGVNVEKKKVGKVRYVTTRDNVAEWLTDRFGKILSQFNIPVVKDGGTLSLEADIVQYYVTEESRYKANIGLKIRLRSKNGDVLWKGMSTVTDSSWGRSYKAEKYHETLSNACIAVVYSLLKNESFLQAVEKASRSSNEK